MSTGSLGQGVSCAAGMAKGAKYLNEDVNAYTLLGDGEIEEGQVWEAFMFAAHFKLDNLCVIIDLNGLQIDGPDGEGDEQRAGRCEDGGVSASTSSPSTATTLTRSKARLPRSAPARASRRPS